MPGRWWAERFGDVLLIGLDSTTPRDQEQLDWLAATLQRSHARWTVVALHHPPYSSGYQGSSLDAREAFSPLFEQYEVDLVLSGHEHDYERSERINGVTYVVSGGAAETRRTGKENFTAVAVSWHHFVEIDVLSDRMIHDDDAQDPRSRPVRARSAPRHRPQA
jgi:3',5'-cyclic AMP phosphodiesterase CpdA